MPVPPPVRSVGRGVCVNVCAAERAAGVAVLLGVIQVSVSARKLREFKVAWPTMNSGILFFAAEWQFQRPPLIVMW